MNVRLASRRQANCCNGNLAGMKQSTRFCAVKLGRSHFAPLGQVMDGIYESARLSTEAWRVCSNLGCSINKVKCQTGYPYRRKGQSYGCTIILLPRAYRRVSISASGATRRKLGQNNGDQGLLFDGAGADSAFIREEDTWLLFRIVLEP